MCQHILPTWKATSISFLLPIFATTMAVCQGFDSGPAPQKSETAKPPATSPRVVIHQRLDREFLTTQPTFVITHGMGGTVADDRFHQLADAICDVIPEANVLIVDWSNDSWRTRGYLPIPSPWDVAQNIDPVVKEAAQLLKTLQIDSTRTVFIGESFGVCVNAGIAEALGGRGRILAFNPPSNLSGYKSPDLRLCSDVACSFQTYSMFDSQSPIADLGLFLETPSNANPNEQHTFGIVWLTQQIQSSETAWLHPALVLPEPATESFDAIVTIQGDILIYGLPRCREFQCNTSDKMPTIWDHR